MTSKPIKTQEDLDRATPNATVLSRLRLNETLVLLGEADGTIRLTATLRAIHPDFECSVQFRFGPQSSLQNDPEILPSILPDDMADVLMGPIPGKGV